MTRSTVLAMLAVVATPSVVVGQGRFVTEMDVAGVRLGATPVEVRTALLRAGYRIISDSSTQSFEQSVRREAARRRSRLLPLEKAAGTSSITGSGPHREYADVSFEQVPSGSKVHAVTVQIPPEAMTTEAFQRQVLAKYGTPDSRRNAGTSMYWCSPEALRACGKLFRVDDVSDDAYPMLTAGGTGGYSLRLRSGELAYKQVGRDHEAAVLKLVPKTGNGAF